MLKKTSKSQILPSNNWLLTIGADAFGQTCWLDLKKTEIPFLKDLSFKTFPGEDAPTS